jgi:hypothetical protein
VAANMSHRASCRGVDRRWPRPRSITRSAARSLGSRRRSALLLVQLLGTGSKLGGCESRR